MTLRWWNPVSWFVGIALWVRGLFPWTQDGRRTSLHVAVLCAGPMLTAMMIWVMFIAVANSLFATFTNLAYVVASALLIVVTAISVGTGLNIFVKAGKDGFTGGAGSGDEAVDAARQVVDAAEKEKEKIVEAAAAQATDPLIDDMAAKQDADAERRRLAAEQGNG